MGLLLFYNVIDIFQISVLISNMVNISSFQGPQQFLVCKAVLKPESWSIAAVIHYSRSGIGG